jgi:hypothetical protein
VLAKTAKGKGSPEIEDQNGRHGTSGRRRVRQCAVHGLPGSGTRAN